MEKINSEIALAIIIGSLVVIVLVVFLLLFFLLFSKKKQKLFKDKVVMQQQFELELLKTQFEVQEKTSKYLAEELHDNIGQILSLTNVTLASVQITDTAKATQKITDAQSLITLSIKELRQLSKIIHGEQILQQGLIAAIQQEVNWIKRNEQYSIEFVYSINETVERNADKNLFIYRLVQECLNNILKHAEANKIAINLLYKNELLQIILHDNGKGFLVEKTMANQTGLGLNNMQKRINLLNGKMNIESSSVAGTTIQFSIPYP